MDEEIARGLKERYAAVAARVAAAAERAGRKPEEIRIVAVSKTVDAHVASLAAGVGMHDFGENRPDMLMDKYAALPHETWHFIGNIQSRRVKDIVGRAALIHSVENIDHLRKIDAVAGERGLVQPVLLEVNISGEESKSGFSPDEVAAAIQASTGLSSVEVRGLMTMAPQAEEAIVRATFSGLRELRDSLRASLGDSLSLQELSMGMSGDFEIAVEEGATIVRVGRSIFSQDF